METLLNIIPLALIVIIAVVAVWRGMRTKPDDAANRTGKSDTHYWGGPGSH